MVANASKWFLAQQILKRSSILELGGKKSDGFGPGIFSRCGIIVLPGRVSKGMTDAEIQVNLSRFAKIIQD